MKPSNRMQNSICDTWYLYFLRYESFKSHVDQSHKINRRIQKSADFTNTVLVMDEFIDVSHLSLKNWTLNVYLRN